MLIPSIDLQGGRIVQLVQGERLAIETDDFDGWIERFRGFPEGAADRSRRRDGRRRQRGARRARSAARLPCRVGGGIRTIERARDVLVAPAPRRSSSARRSSATAPSTSAFASAAPRRSASTASSPRSTAAAATSSIHGWRTTAAAHAVDAVRALEPYCGEFLYTHVDNEGLMQGTDMDAIRAVRDATTRRADRRRRDHHAGGDRRARRASASTPWSAWPSIPAGATRTSLRSQPAGPRVN